MGGDRPNLLTAVANGGYGQALIFSLVNRSSTILVNKPTGKIMHAPEKNRT
jgi:hypothetical protein